MQELEYLLDVVLTFAVLVLYGTVVWALLRYATQPKHRYWAIGWVVYSIGAIFGVLVSTSGLVPSDIISLSLMFFGSRLILDGSRSAYRPIQWIAYPVGFVFLLLDLLLGLYLSVSFFLVFLPLAIHVAYACIISAKAVYESTPQMRRSDWWLVGGLLFWASSWFVFPFGLFFPESFYFDSMILQAGGILVTGSAMLTYFLKNVTEDLEVQYQVSQIMSSVVQHDIRNYLQTIRNSLELAEGEPHKQDHWVELAGETVDRASDFIDDMRMIAASLTRERSPRVEVPMREMIQQVKERVSLEYALGSDDVWVEVPDSVTVTSCGLLRELLWNIFDNAFKHGSSRVVVRTMSEAGHVRDLTIEDDGGGLPPDVKEFMNRPDSLKRPVAPGLGLGVILIRGLAMLCGVHLEVTDCITGSTVTGTCFHLVFDTSARILST